MNRTEPTEANWPNDADGDILRRLKVDGFDFSMKHDVDFVIDFVDWPPSEEALKFLQSEFSSIRIYFDSEFNAGNVTVTVKSIITYEFVISVQRDINSKLKHLKGWCESWGVWHDKAT